MTMNKRRFLLIALTAIALLAAAATANADAAKPL
jgi:hypothetical protein